MSELREAAQAVVADWDRRLLMVKRVAAMVDYNPETGVMTWLPRVPDVNRSAAWNKSHAGTECGAIDSHGYRVLHVRLEPGQRFNISAHRVAWFITFGTLPNGEIDHINQNKSDNRISNLRDVPASLNQRNKIRNKNNKSGVAGVHWDGRRGKWKARAKICGLEYCIGSFDQLADAEAALKKFRAKHGFTELHGRAA